ncbi:MAG: tRNA pseudouridine(38-40) synthase TruA [candidate division Zixibacteria bacterium]|nr:tRNA pseudouridine(38-40) synthase TruA [candidate division Zixibacteria bacterium]
MQRNIKLEIEYEGTDFSGWQIQPKLRTVQGEIQDKLQTILGHKINLIGAGRTDVGVHALGQAANFKTTNELSKNSIINGLNGLLPDDIVIKRIEEVDLNFNSRYDAKSRLYKYRIYLGRTAIWRKYVWEVLYSLNLENILEATKKIQGEHDFSSFCVAESTKNNNACRVFSAIWEKSSDELIFKIEADRFLHAMVRSLVGTLIEVGRGYFSVSDFVNIMEVKDRKKAGPTAPACGLYLAEVKY